MTRIALADPAATDRFAQAFAGCLGPSARAASTGQPPWLIALEGELGAGKSHFARAMLRALGVTGPVPSPTYSLVESYPEAAPAAVHMDWYRLADPLELEMLDWDALCAAHGVVLVEWASRLPDAAVAWDVGLSFAPMAPNEGAGRTVDITAHTRRANALLASFDALREDISAG
ncbi:MAG: tRNA (adenosine(37)-N6)-threonylcarbamoyltransferase complex ATPase subunit type 1 TsaE [Oceanococcaceae bacterium]